MVDSSIFYENLKTRVAERVGMNGAAALESLGFLADEPLEKRGTPLDTISHYLTERLRLGKICFKCSYIIGTSCSDKPIFVKMGIVFSFRTQRTFTGHLSFYKSRQCFMHCCFFLYSFLPFTMTYNTENIFPYLISKNSLPDSAALTYIL